MKKIILAVTLLSLALGFSTAQETGSVKKVQVTAQTLASLPANQPYRMDFARKGTVYELAAGLDYSRVRISFRGDGATWGAYDTVALSDVARKLGVTGSKFLLGTFSDLRALDYGFPPGGGTVQPPDGGTVVEFKHDKQNGIYTCVGRKDCSELSKSGKCGPIAGCGKNIDDKGNWGCACLEP